MPKGSKELTDARKQEIVNACAALYETMGFKDITIRDIGAKTTFSRTSIYNYFQTKEEIFLALLQQEHEQWAADLAQLAASQPPLCAAGFAGGLAHTLEKRNCMLKLISMNLYDMEVNSRIENLVAFKKAYAGSLEALSRCLQAAFPQMGAADIQRFLYAFFPFLFGVYPYTCHTEKQLQAMQLAHIEAPQLSVYQLTKDFVAQLLQPFTGQAACPAAGHDQP